MAENLSFSAGINRSQWKSDIEAMRKDVLGLNNAMIADNKRTEGSFRNLGVGIAGALSVGALQGFTMQLINVRGEFQKTEIAFTTMLRSADKAKALMGQMVELAAKTPFGLQDVADGAKRLLAFQIPANQVVETLTRIGNVAAGLGVPMGQLIHVYGQVKAQGRLMTNDLYQFMNAGIPMTAELAKVMGVAENKVKDLITEGKVGFPQVQQVIQNLTNEGGMFFNLMEAQSASLSGKVANLGDSFDQMLNSLGQSNEGILYDGIEALTFMVENYETLIEILGVAVATYGAYKTALIANHYWSVLNQTATVQQALAHGTLSIAQARGAAASIMLQNAQKGLNAAMMANPIGIVIGLLAGLSYVIYKNVTATNAYIDLQDKLKDSTQNHSKSIDEQKAKINSLVAIIKDKNTTDAQAKVALEKINALTGNRIKNLSIEEIRLGKTTGALGNYIKMLELEARAKSLIETRQEAEKKEREIRNDSFNNLTVGERFGNFREAGDMVLTAQQRKRKAMIEDLQAIWKTKAEVDRELMKLQKQGVDIGEAFSETGDAAAKGVDAAKKKTEKAAEKIYGEDTVKGIQQRLSKLNETIEITPISSTVLNGMILQREVLEKKLADAQKRIAVKKFDEQVAEIKRQIEVRDKLLEAGSSKDTVDNMFPQIKDGGYESYLNKAAASIKKLIDEGKGSEEAANNFALVTDELEKYKGYDSYIDSVGKSIEALKSKFSGDALLDQLDLFGDSNIGNETEANQQAKKNAVNKAKEEELNNQRQLYQDFIKEQETFEQKKLAITAKYKVIEDQIAFSNASTDEKNRLLSEAAKKRGEEYSTAFLSGLKNSGMWQKAFGNIAEMTNREIKQSIELLKTQLAQATADGTPVDQIATFQNRITELENVLKDNPFERIRISWNKFGEEKDPIKKIGLAQEMFQGLGQGVNMLSDAFGGFDERTEATIGNIMAIGGSALELGKSIASGDVAGMIKAGIELIGSIGKALNGDQKKERQIKKQAALVKELERAYTDLSRAADKAFGSQKYDAQKDLVKNLEQQKAALVAMMNTESTKKKKDQGKIDDYKSQIQAINGSIEDIKRGIVEDVLQTDVVSAAQAVGDALVDAYGRGESAIAAVDKAANDMVKNLLKNQLNLILQKKMEKPLNDLLKAAGFDENGNGTFTGLSNEKISEFQDAAKAVGQDMQGFLNAYSDIFRDMETNSANSMTGAIKGVSEETASLIAGQMNAIRINQAEVLTISRANQEVFRNMLLQIIQIEANTRRLHNIDKNITELNAKTKNGLAGVG